MNNTPEVLPPTKKGPEEIKKQLRIFGAILAILGATVAIIFIGWPAYQAHIGAESVTLFRKWAGGGVALFFWGLVTVILGDIPLPNSNTDKLTAKHLAYIALGASLIGGSFYLTNKYFNSLGYTEKQEFAE